MLIDTGTSGAAEVFASALAGNHRADLIGEHTIGRAASQKLVRLPDGAGLWLSTTRYLTPAGTPLHEKGLEPTVPVDEPDVVEFGQQPPTADPILDKALERLTEGPTYATLWDLDRKLLNAQKLWLKRSEDIAAYQAIVQAAWRRAIQRFVDALNDPKAPPLKSGREFLDLWIATANACLLEMHRSDEFLEAQRKMTRSATEYRLQEREIAEAFCAMHHIPTRTEMDEVQHAVYELRRELRALQRKGEGKLAKPAPTPRSGKRPAAKAKAKRKAKRVGS